MEISATMTQKNRLKKRGEGSEQKEPIKDRN